LSLNNVQIKLYQYKKLIEIDKPQLKLNKQKLTKNKTERIFYNKDCIKLVKKKRSHETKTIILRSQKTNTRFATSSASI